MFWRARLIRRSFRRDLKASAKEHGIRLIEAGVAAVVFVLLLQWALGFSIADPEFWRRFLPALQRGFLGTAFYTAIVIPLGLVIGFFWGWARLSRHRVLAWPVGFLIEALRGIPPLVLIIFAFLFGLALIPPQANPLETAFLVAAFALALHSAAYQAEIFRAGFQSVPREQVDAAEAVGMTKGATMGAVILPQALRLSLPPLGNEFATVIKDTSLLGAIGATELFFVGQEFSQRVPLLGQLQWIFAIWTSVAFVYFLITFTVTRGLRLVEYFLRTPGMEASRT